MKQTKKLKGADFSWTVHWRRKKQRVRPQKERGVCFQTHIVRGGSK